MGKFVQLVVDGLSTGSIYGAIALAIVLVNQATGLINFAQGGMAVLSAYVAWWQTTHGVPIVVAILVSILFSFALGAVGGPRLGPRVKLSAPINDDDL
jgi:branched-chain amino acid transport system permease protein